MPDPTRPVAGAPIDTDWGQQIHDRVFEPRGTRVHAAPGSGSSVGTTFAQLQLDTADDDPGGWLGSDELEVPTGAGGLYSYTLRVNVDGDNNEAVRLEMRVNGSAFLSERRPLEADVMLFVYPGLVNLSAGDILQVWARASEAGTAVRVLQFDLLIQGTSIGA